MTYSSQHYNVSTYPKLFQDWTNSNLAVVLEQMNFLKFNVTAIETAKRIVVSTQSPTISPVPSTEPTEFPTISLLPTSKVEEPTTTTPYKTIAPTMKVVETTLNESNDDNII